MSYFPDSPGEDEDEQIIELLEHTVVGLGMTEDGNVGVWLGATPDWTETPYAVGTTATEALVIAASMAKMAREAKP